MSTSDNSQNATGNAASIIANLKANARTPTVEKCRCGIERGGRIDPSKHSEECVREMFGELQDENIPMGFEIDDLSAITTTLANIVEYLLNDYREIASNVRDLDYQFHEIFLLPVAEDQVGNLAFWSVRRWEAIREVKQWLIDQRMDHVIEFAAHRDQDLCVRFRDKESAAMFKLRWGSGQ